MTHPYGLVVTIWPTQEIGLGQQASNKLKIMKFDALFCQLIIMNQLYFEIEERFMLFLSSKRISIDLKKLKILFLQTKSTADFRILKHVQVPN